MLVSTPVLSTVRKNIRAAIISSVGTDWFDTYRIIPDSSAQRLVVVFSIKGQTSFNWAYSYDFGKSVSIVSKNHLSQLDATLSAFSRLERICNAGL